MRNLRLALLIIFFITTPFITCHNGHPIPIYASPINPSFTYADWVQCLETVEQFYWEHRYWPKDNPGPKPSYHELIPRHFLENRAMTILKQLHLLNQIWNTPITYQEIQNEINRMARESAMPERLKSLWNRLDNDPAKIALCLALPQIVEQKVRKIYDSLSLTAFNEQDNPLKEALKAYTQWLETGRLAPGDETYILEWI